MTACIMLYRLPGNCPSIGLNTSMCKWQVNSDCTAPSILAPTLSTAQCYAVKHKQLHDARLLISLDYFGTQQTIIVVVNCARDKLQIRTKRWQTSWMLTLS